MKALTEIPQAPGRISRAGRTGRAARSDTIYEVAQQAGVSIATVSRVMRGTAGVAPGTRERVLRSAVGMFMQMTRENPES